MSLDNFKKQTITWDMINQPFEQPIQIMEGDVNARTLLLKITDNGSVLDLTGHSVKLTYQYVYKSQSGFIMLTPSDISKGEFTLKIPTEMTVPGLIKSNLILLNESLEQVIVSKNLTFISDNSTVTDLAQEVNNKIDDFTKLLLENMPQVMRSELNDLHAQTESNKNNIELKANLADMTSLQNAMTNLQNEVEAFGITPENSVTIKSLLDEITSILSDLSQKGIDISDLNRRADELIIEIKNANAELIASRNGKSNLKTRIDDLENETTAQLAEKVNKDEVANGLTAKGAVLHANLPTTGNTVGDYYYCSDGDGVHPAGNYVWNGTVWYFGGTGDDGYNLLKEDIFDINNSIYTNNTKDITLEESTQYAYTTGFYLALNKIANTIVLSGANTYSAFAQVDVKNGETYKVSGKCPYSSGVYPQIGLCFADINGNLITDIVGQYDYFCGITSTSQTPFFDYIVNVPENAKKMYVGTTSLGGYPIIIKKVQRISQFEIIEEKIADVSHKNQIWSIIGDSWSDINNSYATKRYFDWISDQCGFTINNVAVGGSGFKRKEETANGSKAFYQQALLIDTDADLVTVFGGGNDCSQDYIIGNVEDAITDTLCGAINTLITNIQTKAPKSHIIIFSPAPWTNYNPMIDDGGKMGLLTTAIKNVCAYRGVHFKDMFHDSGLRPYESAFKSVYFNSDGVHPKAEGHKWIYPKIKAEIVAELSANDEQ